MTHRLYYTDSLLTEFNGTVIEVGTVDGRHVVVLDRTAFYPTSGGQPHDVGRLGPAGVLDVTDREDDGAVLHVVDAPFEVGQVVTGMIDRERRHDHMQQHSGQHVLSAALVRACDAATVSFHLGTDVSTIDVAATLDTAGIARGEDEANRVVWEDRPVTIRSVTAEEAATLPLRKEPRRAGLLRLVEIDDWDLSACGGTHVSRTGSIGNITVTGWERYKGGTRIAFACGRRALRHARRLVEVTDATSKLLSVQVGDAPDAVARLQSESREQRLKLRSLEESLATFEAARLAAEARDVNGVRLVATVLDRDAAGLKSLAQAIVTHGASVLLVSHNRPVLIVAARGNNEPRFDSKAIIAALTTRFGGKGGGRSELAQAGGLDEEPERVLEAAVENVRG